MDVVRTLFLFAAGALTWIASSCVGGSRGLVSALVEPNPQYQHGASTSEWPSKESKPKPWWQAFKDNTLDQLMRQGLTGNLELQSLVARIEQADAALRQAHGRLLPELNADGSYGVRWTDSSDDSQAVRETSMNLGGLLDWEIDLWGRLRSARAARRLEREAAIADWRGARLLLSVSIAETYFEMLEQERQLRLLDEQIAAGQTLLDLTELRFGQAQSSVVDVLQQREQLAATKTRVPTVEGRLVQLTLTLHVLLGQAPGHDMPRIAGELKAPPALPALGVPADLLVDRPDLLASAQRVAALDYEVAEAIADRLPRLRLGGSLSGIGGPGIDTLIANAVASVAAPVIDGGIRKAEVAKRQAAVREALAAFSQQYLEAAREVETALILERKQAERVRLLGNQLGTAQSLLTESRNRYRQGLTDYLPVLTALETVQQLEREHLTSRRELLSFRIALHRALGGPLSEEDR